MLLCTVATNSWLVAYFFILFIYFFQVILDYLGHIRLFTNVGRAQLREKK